MTLESIERSCYKDAEVVIPSIYDFVGNVENFENLMGLAVHNEVKSIHFTDIETTFNVCDHKFYDSFIVTSWVFTLNMLAKYGDAYVKHRVDELVKLNRELNN